jgi:tetratricopeptide (TPR) repeat protein
MERIEKTVFLSYRRTNAPWALAIFQSLTHHDYDVFFDFSGVASGDFERVIIGNIKARAHFLVLLTPSALERCGEPGDWLRREIETALDTQRNIVPLMLEGFDFGAPGIASGLTGTLAPLKHYNALRVPMEYFEEAMQRLRDRYLSVALDAVLHPASPFAQRAAKDEQAAAGAAPAVTEKELTAQQWLERAFYTADLDERSRFLSEAIRLQPDYASGFNSRAIARVAKGDLDGALQDYDEAIRLQSDNAVFLCNRGVARHAKGDLEGALQDYNEAIRLKPDYARAFNNQGDARYDKGDLEGALQDYDEAIRIKPDEVLAFRHRSAARFVKGDLKGALQDLNEAIRLKPDFAHDFHFRGIMRETEGDLEGALQDFNEAIRLDPDAADAFDSRGEVRADQGDLDGALQDYKEAIRLGFKPKK